MKKCEECDREIAVGSCVRDKDKSLGLISKSFICGDCAEKARLPLDAILQDSGNAVRTVLFSEQQAKLLLSYTRS